MNPIKILKSIAIFFLFLFIFSGSALAQEASISLTTSPRTIEKGDVFSVIIKVSSSGESIGTVTADLSYDEALMEYSSGGGNSVMISEGKGKISDFNAGRRKTVSYELSFIAKSSGKGGFKVNESEIIGSETGMFLGDPTASINISVNEPIIKEEIEAPKIDPDEDPIKITIGEKDFYILRDLSAVALEDGFEEKDFYYKGSKVKAATDSSGKITLLPVMNDKMQSLLYFYEEENDMLYPFSLIKIDKSHLILPMDIEAEGYEKTSYLGLGASVDVLMSKDGEKDFYLLKAVAADGKEGYYLYDIKENTMQRAITNKGGAVIKDQSGMIDLLMSDKEVFYSFAAMIIICLSLGMTYGFKARKK